MVNENIYNLNLNNNDEIVDKIYKPSLPLGMLLRLNINQRYSRLEITLKMMDYIRNKNLRNRSNSRLIDVNDELNNIFGVIEPFSYTSLRNYLTNHLLLS